MSGELRNKNVAEPWMVEVNNKMKDRLPSSQNSIMNIDGSFLQYRTRMGDGHSLSREYQVHILIERKQIFPDGSVEQIGPSQMDQLYKLHAKSLQPYAVIKSGCRDIRNFGSLKFQGNRIHTFGVAVLYMNRSTIDQSDSFIWKRPALRMRKNPSRVCVRCTRPGLCDVEPRDWVEFKTNDPNVIWEILAFVRDPNNPSEIYSDRSHHKINNVRVKEEVSELGMTFDSYRHKNS